MPHPGANLRFTDADGHALGRHAQPLGWFGSEAWNRSRRDRQFHLASGTPRRHARPGSSRHAVAEVHADLAGGEHRGGTRGGQNGEDRHLHDGVVRGNYSSDQAQGIARVLRAGPTAALMATAPPAMVDPADPTSRPSPAHDTARFGRPGANPIWGAAPDGPGRPDSQRRCPSAGPAGPCYVLSAASVGCVPARDVNADGVLLTQRSWSHHCSRLGSRSVLSNSSPASRCRRHRSASATTRGAAQRPLTRHGHRPNGWEQRAVPSSL